MEKPKAFLPVQIVYVWAVVFIAMGVYAIVWFTNGIWVMMLIDSLTSSYTFAEPWATVVNFVRWAFLIHPVIALLFWFLYGALNSVKRDVDQWRV
jgi:hypothetical protein